MGPEKMILGDFNNLLSTLDQSLKLKTVNKEISEQIDQIHLTESTELNQTTVECTQKLLKNKLHFRT